MSLVTSWGLLGRIELSAVRIYVTLGLDCLVSKCVSICLGLRRWRYRKDRMNWFQIKRGEESKLRKRN